MLMGQDLEKIKRNIYYERYLKAETMLNDVLSNSSNNAELWYLLIKTQILNKQIDSAATTLNNVPAAVANEPFLKIARGFILLHQDKPGADELFKQALDDTKRKNVGIREEIAFANIHAKGGNAGYALQVLNSLRKKDKKSAQWYILTGDAYRKMNNGNEAYKRYQQALQSDERYAKAYYRLGQIFSTQKNNNVYVQYFEKAVHADPEYDPALYELYLYQFYHDPAKAMSYYTKYLEHRQVTIENQYDLVDLLYLNKEYEDALTKARYIVRVEKDSIQPRIYKLFAYSYAGLKDTAEAVEYMNKYFASAPDSSLILEDFKSMASFLNSTGNDKLGYDYLTRGVSHAAISDTTSRLPLYSKLATIAGENENYDEQAKWLERYYLENRSSTNLDLFNWGLAHYKGENYEQAANVFKMYVEKYPEQSFGYYWVARSAALQDEQLEGLAVEPYEKLIEVLQKDTTSSNYKSWMTQAYGYLAAYAANAEKDYSKAIEYFEKILQLEPDNAEAKNYIEVLRKNEEVQAER
jgi:tetratricopeptide (TPR) repeat protein